MSDLYLLSCDVDNMRHAVFGLDFLGFMCYTSSIRKLEKVSKLERQNMLKPQCPQCGRVSVESQDRICPVDKSWMPLTEVVV